MFQHAKLNYYRNFNIRSLSCRRTCYVIRFKHVCEWWSKKDGCIHMVTTITSVYGHHLICERELRHWLTCLIAWHHTLFTEDPLESSNPSFRAFKKINRTIMHIEISIVGSHFTVHEWCFTNEKQMFYSFRIYWFNQWLLAIWQGYSN